MNILLDLFLQFFKIGLFTFGGGYAMISVIEHTCVENKKWITHDEMMNITVIAESTPGPISINAATYVGYQQSGLVGSLCATLGMVLPSFIIIYVISMFLNDFLTIPIVAHAFQGIKIAVSFLILNAAVNMIKKMKKTSFSVIIVIVSCALMLLISLFSWNISSILLLLAAAVIGLVAYQIHQKGDAKQ